MTIYTLLTLLFRAHNHHTDTCLTTVDVVVFDM